MKSILGLVHVLNHILEHGGNGHQLGDVVITKAASTTSGVGERRPAPPSRPNERNKQPRPQAVRKVFLRGGEHDVGTSVFPELAVPLWNQDKIMREMRDAFAVPVVPPE
jgi:hypothetical protein